MIKCLFILVTTVLFSSTAYSGEYASEANNNPFLSGEINPKHEREAISIAGEILATKEQLPFYKLNLNGVSHIWATSIAPNPGGGLKVGGSVIF